MNLPEHKCGLYLEHNVHRNVYDSAAVWCKNNADREMFDWENKEAEARAIAADEIWTLQWYPNTPVGFNSIAAPTLEELLAFASRIEKGENE